MDALRKKLSANDLGLAFKNLQRKDKDWLGVEEILDKESVKERYFQMLGIKNKDELSMPFEEKHANELRKYLSDLDLVIPSFVSVPDKGLRREKNILVLPGLRWNQSETLIKALLSDPSLDFVSPEKVRDLAKAIREAVEGKLLEEIVLRDIMLSLDAEHRWDEVQVFSVHNDSTGAELDVAVKSFTKLRGIFMEVKNSSETVENQARWLRDKDFMDEMTQRMGEPLVKCVLYNGPNAESDGILWRNANAFLSLLEYGMNVEDVAEAIKACGNHDDAGPKIIETLSLY